MVVDVTKGGAKEEDQFAVGHHRKGSNVFDYSRLPLCFSMAQSVVCQADVSFFILAAWSAIYHHFGNFVLVVQLDFNKKSSRYFCRCVDGVTKALEMVNFNHDFTLIINEKVIITMGLNIFLTGEF